MKLSIITINRNNLEGLKKTVSSVLAQSCQDFEWIIVDGASTDGSAEFIRSLNRENLIAVSEPDTGIYNAMNKGVRLSHGEYLHFLNGGDALAEKDSIDTLLKKMGELPGRDIYRCHVYYLDSNGKRAGFCSGCEDIKALYGGIFWFSGVNSIPHQGALIRRGLLEEYPYDESFKIVGDYDFFIHCYMWKRVQDCLLELVLVDFDSTGISNTWGEQLFLERRLCWEKQFGKGCYDDYLAWTTGRGAQGSYYLKLCNHLRRNRFWEKLGCCFLFPVYTASVLTMCVVRWYKRFVLPLLRKVFHSLNS